MGRLQAREGLNCHRREAGESNMKIIVPAIGSRGDVQPYIALCQGLQRARHQVTLATNPTLCSLVASYGVNVAPVGPPVDMGAAGAELWEKYGRFWMIGLIRTMQLGFRLVKQSYPDILELCQAADLVIATDTAAGPTEADKLGIPWFSATLQPPRVPIPTSATSLPVHQIWSVINRLVMSPTNNFRKSVGVLPFKGGLESMLSTHLTLVPVSPHVWPPDSRWASHNHMTGYWIAQSPEQWSPPEDLLAFLAKGERPIAVTLGAMALSGKHAREAAHITLEALRQTGVRAIVQGWPEALANMTWPDTIYRAGSMPHTWLFDQVSAVIHHGGFGTTASTLRAGTPGIVVPHIIDQHIWAQRVVELGVGQSIPRAKLTPANLAEAIARAMRDAQMRDKAAAIGQQIRAEPDGVQTAVTLIEQRA